MKKIILTILLVLFFVFSQNAIAQKASDSISGDINPKWGFLAEPYLMFPNMKGTTGIGNLPNTEVDADPSDIFSNLQVGAMLYMEASKDKWHIATDFIYMNLKQDIEPKLIINGGYLRAKQLAFNVTGLYSVNSWLDVGIGGMLNSIKLETNISAIGEVFESENTETWFDPMLIARTQSEPKATFVYQVRADIGGFGIGSDFAYQLQFYAGYRFSKLFQLTGGYRIIGLDYEKGSQASITSGSDYFLYDMITFGPVIRLGFSF